jgi:hypothetical protein
LPSHWFPIPTEYLFTFFPFGQQETKNKTFPIAAYRSLKLRALLYHRKFWMVCSRTVYLMIFSLFKEEFSHLKLLKLLAVPQLDVKFSMLLLTKNIGKS